MSVLHPFSPQESLASGGPTRPARGLAGQRGSVLPLVALVILALGGLCVALGGMGRDAVAVAQAQTAADAAALAGAAEGEEAARGIAGENGAELVGYVQEGLDVEVRARVGEAEAVARATRTDPGAAIGGGSEG